MSMPSRKFEPENQVQQRVARLEAHTEHIQSDVTEVKAGMRRLDGKIDAVKDGMEQGFAALNEKVDRKTAWIIGLMVTLTLALATAGAGGFLWLADRISALSAVSLGH